MRSAYKELVAPLATLSFFNDGWRLPGASLSSPLSAFRPNGYGFEVQATHASQWGEAACADQGQVVQTH